MERIASEAASLAGHLRLGKLIYLYDDNEISLSGSANLSFTENAQARFSAYGWHTHKLVDGNNLEDVDDAIREAQSITDSLLSSLYETTLDFEVQRSMTRFMQMAAYWAKKRWLKQNGVELANAGRFLHSNRGVRALPRVT